MRLDRLRPSGEGRRARPGMGRLRVLIACGGVAAVLLGTAPGRPARAAEPAAAGPEAAASRPVGSLVICGGGMIPEAVRTRFLDLAGGKAARLVVIPTATRFADNPDSLQRILAPWVAAGVESITVLHTRSRTTADDPEFSRPIAAASGVWLGGGLQELLTQAYVGTEVERQLKALLDRGGVIGGTSAGAAVMTRVMITGGRKVANLGEGFDLLPNAVVDQHFLRRNRLGRLQSVLARHPRLVGLGIDERTALVVQGPQLQVLGESYVVACLPESADGPAHQEILRPGQSLSLTTLTGATPMIAEASRREAVVEPVAQSTGR